jgi:hypothetical protein
MDLEPAPLPLHPPQDDRNLLGVKAGVELAARRPLRQGGGDADAPLIVECDYHGRLVPQLRLVVKKWIIGEPAEGNRLP